MMLVCVFYSFLIFLNKKYNDIIIDNKESTIVKYDFSIFSFVSKNSPVKFPIKTIIIICIVNEEYLAYFLSGLLFFL